MFQKTLQTFQEPKMLVLTSLVTGLVAPSVFRYLKHGLSKLISSKKQEAHIYVGIQLGGTNFNVSFGKPQFDRQGKIRDFKLLKQHSGRVTNPEQTLSQIADFVNNGIEEGKTIFFVGIACFGPLQLDKNSDKYGYITSCPKPGWADTPVLKTLKDKINCDNFAIETDVNAAAFAQSKLCNHGVKESLCYVTVGTGVGVGVVAHNLTIHGLTHPEGGHIMVKRHEKQFQGFEGVCPFHKDCLQGMTANKSISVRSGVDFVRLHEIEDGDKIWEIVGYYLAQLCLNLTLTVSPQKIIIGGGISNRKILLKHIHENFIKLLAEYIEHSNFTHENIHNYIVTPMLGSSVGVKSAMLLRFM